MSKNKTILVIFGKSLPEKSQKWWGQLNAVVGPKTLKEKIENMGLFFVDIEGLIDGGSVQEARQLVDKLSQLTLPDGRRLPKIVNYKGYELWWINYDKFMENFCLPYTQYRRLLQYLKDFNKAYLYRVPHSGPFGYFLNAYGCQCVILDESKKIFPPLGILVQVILSLPFLLWLRITRPKLMVWTSDQFDPAHPPHDYDFRMRFIYEELRKRKIPFVEFIRSQEHLTTVLKHVLERKRPVIYSWAIISLLHFFAKFFGKRKEKELMNLCVSKEISPEKLFWLLVATHYLRNFTGTIWSIKAMKFVLQLIGVRAAIIIAGSSRTFHEILACKLIGIKTVGIQHGLSPRHLNVYEFMPGFDGELTLTPDMYGLCSDWWKREYFLIHSRAFRPGQFYVSGHMRPLEKEIPEVAPPAGGATSTGPIKVLFVSEALAVPSEVIPYLLSLLKTEDFVVFLKLRSYRDVFEEWLKENYPAILEKTRILKSGMHDAISQANVVVGSYSTGTLEALLQLKPFVFFRTGKWGECLDYLETKSFNSQGSFFAENPEGLLDRIRKSQEIPKEVLMELREKFFGNPYQNGSKWVVDQAEKFL